MAPTAVIRTLPRFSEEPFSGTCFLAMAEKCRDFRLHALMTAPEAFASSYEVENERGIDHTLQRLKKLAKAVHLVALSGEDEYSQADKQSGGIGYFLSREWLGTIVLLGPQTEQDAAVSAKTDPFAKQTAVGQKAGEANGINSTLHYHLNGMFVDSAARGRGIGMALIGAALSQAETVARVAKADLKVTIIVDTWNTAARRLYEKAGFVVVGEETYVQQPRALVDQEARAVERTAYLLELKQNVW